MAGIWYLHGITAVAELKHQFFVLVHDVEQLDLHGITAVAELKHGGQRDVDDRGDVISTASPPWPN